MRHIFCSSIRVRETFSKRKFQFSIVRCVGLWSWFSIFFSFFFSFLFFSAVHKSTKFCYWMYAFLLFLFCRLLLLAEIGTRERRKKDIKFVMKTSKNANKSQLSFGCGWSSIKNGKHKKFKIYSSRLLLVLLLLLLFMKWAKRSGKKQTKI